VRIPDHASLDTGDSFTLELWLKRTPFSQVTGTEGLFLKGYQLLRDGNGAIVLRKPGVREIARSRTRITDTEFHHVVATKHGPDVHLYVDGVDVTGPVNNLPIGDTGGQLSVGSGANSFRGILDEVAVYGRALGAREVEQHFDAASVVHGPLP
jgi:hypothetical protein